MSTTSLKKFLELRNFFSERIAFGEDVFDRIALFIYGINENKNLQNTIPRRDGVIKGMDFALTNRKIPFESDDDTKRIAVFYNESSPYSLNSSGTLMLKKRPTYTFLKPFIYKKYIFNDYLYYLRSNRYNLYNKLVLNPYRNCNSMCKWCARTYPDHKKIYAKLKNNGNILDKNVEIKAIRKIPQRLVPPKELFDHLMHDVSIINPNAKTFSFLEELAFITGDFPPGFDVSAYIFELIMLMKNNGFIGTIYYAGHQIESKEDMLKLKNTGLKVTFVYTVEHFTGRLELMPVKGKRTLNEIADILYGADEIFGKNNVFYYYIAGIDDLESTYDNFVRFKPLAKPLVSVLTPYNTEQFELYYYKNKIKIPKQMFDVRELILQLWGEPIPSGSNRSLFPLNAINRIM